MSSASASLPTRATGIAFDAFLVRMTLGPALMALMGRAAWWMPTWLARILPNVDIEGESLRDHIDSAAWAQEQRGMAITADALTVGLDGVRIGPVDLAVPEGAVLLAVGPALERRLLAATLAGRLGIVSGRAQVAGHPLPSERDRVARRVAMIDVGGLERAGSDPTWRELVEERLRVTLPWYRAVGARRAAAEWIGHVHTAMGGTGAEMRGAAIDPDAHIRSLPRVERAIALASVALAEAPAIVVLDLPDAFPGSGDEQVFLDAVSAIAPGGTTIVIGSGEPFGVARLAARETVLLSLAEFEAGGEAGLPSLAGDEAAAGRHAPGRRPARHPAQQPARHPARPEGSTP